MDRSSQPYAKLRLLVSEMTSIADGALCSVVGADPPTRDGALRGEVCLVIIKAHR